MNRAPLAQAGGAIIADHGPIGLVQVLELGAFYRAEARLAADAGAARWAAACADRALAFAAAAHAAARWRRAAGWADPRDADEGRAVLFRGGDI